MWRTKELLLGCIFISHKKQKMFYYAAKRALEEFMESSTGYKSTHIGERSMCQCFVWSSLKISSTKLKPQCGMLLEQRFHFSNKATTIEIKKVLFGFSFWIVTLCKLLVSKPKIENILFNWADNTINYYTVIQYFQFLLS